MKKIFILFVLLSVSKLVFAQDITGLWQSEDGSRVYEVKNNRNVYSAILIKSTRPNDRPGVVILDNVKCKRSTKMYEGAIMAADDGDAAFVKITIAGDELHFKIRRMFFDYVHIKWQRVR